MLEQVVVVAFFAVLILASAAIIGVTRKWSKSQDAAQPAGSETVVVYREGKTWRAIRPVEEHESSPTGRGASAGAAVDDLLERQERGSGTRIRRDLVGSGKVAR